MVVVVSLANVGWWCGGGVLLVGGGGSVNIFNR